MPSKRPTKPINHPSTITLPATKQCRGCHTSRDNGYFRRGHTPDGLCGICLICEREARQKTKLNKKAALVNKLKNKSYITDSMLRQLAADDGITIDTIIGRFIDALQTMTIDEKSLGPLISLLKMFHDRLEGKVLDKVEVSADEGTKKLLADADVLLMKIRKTVEPETVTQITEIAPLLKKED